MKKTENSYKKDTLTTGRPKKNIIKRLNADAENIAKALFRGADGKIKDSK